MSLKSTSSQNLAGELSQEGLPKGAPLQDALMIVLVAIAGVLFAINIMPLWLPGLTFSATGSMPKIFWFLSRGSAIAAFWIFWLSMGMGIIITNKMAQIWPGIPPAYEIHQYTSLLGVGFALFHALILMGDHFIAFDLVQVFLPFAAVNYRPTWVGIGQLGFYVWVIVVLSFYVRKRIGKKAWRLIHFASYASFLGIIIHGIYSGTDAPTSWMQALYWFGGGSLLLLTVYRVLISRFPAAAQKPKRTLNSSS
jgi:predicted ferric reductase